MILIADSGSTKTDWCLIDHGQVVLTVKTRGFNPFFQTEDEIAQELQTALVGKLPSTTVNEVFFYGAGCTPEKSPIVETALRRELHIVERCEVATDMLAAARSLCGHKPGIACILGTGSNSCAYDGQKITHNVSPLGFILGDEGSGAVLGKTLVGDILKNQLPKPIIEAFHAKYNLTAAEIIDKVYRQKLPNRFLAGFVPFLNEHMAEESIENLVVESFRRFLVRNVKQYADWQTLPIGFNGSIAHYFKAQLEKALQAEGMTLGRIIQAPMEGLVDYHTHQI
ncbi:MAG TPA: ATPase [Prevotella sp.]